jgi:hypothetical protein
VNKRLKKPCNDCPFRRTSSPGWLGGAPPSWFVSSALADTYSDGSGNEAAPCHETIDYDDPAWQQDQLPAADACVGSLIFYRNVDAFKLPRDHARSRLVQSVQPDHDTVFSTADEFVQHHEGSGARSWEQA